MQNGCKIIIEMEENSNSQKVNLNKTYLLFKYIYLLVASLPSLGILDKIDHEIKQLIK